MFYCKVVGSLEAEEDSESGRVTRHTDTHARKDDIVLRSVGL